MKLFKTLITIIFISLLNFSLNAKEKKWVKLIGIQVISKQKFIRKH